MAFTTDRIILLIFGITFVIGGIDFLLGNKFGCGKKFHEGLQTFAPLFLTMAGFIVLTPVLVKVLAPVIVPVFEKMGMDPGVFSGIILACDNGAYTLAQELGKAPEAAGFGGILLGSMLGANVVSIPLVLQLLSKGDQKIFFKGFIFGIITVPVGLIAGGLAAGYPFKFIISQIPLLVILSVATVILFLKVPELLIKFLSVFAKSMEIIAVAGLMIAVFLYLSGFSLPGIISIQEPIKIVGSIVIVLPGVYVFTDLLSRGLKKVLPVIGRILKINNIAIIGFLTTVANAVPTLIMMKDMDDRGKFLNCAFIVSGAYMLGDHLAFCGAVVPELIVPLIVTKLTSGAAAVLTALIYLRKHSL